MHSRIALALAVVFAQDARPKVDPAITRDDLAACVGVLASDDLKGRAIGSPECGKAGEYLASRLALAGVEPAGDDGTFFQQVPLAVTRYKSIPKLLLSGASGAAGEGTAGVDFDLRGSLQATAQLAVRVVARAEDVPAQPDAKVALFVDGSYADSRKWLGDAGGQGFGLLLRRGGAEAGKKPMSAPPSGGGMQLGSESGPAHTPMITINGPLLERLRKREVTSVRVEVEVARETIPAFNVVGRIGGVGTKDEPALKDETVMFSAHYDHLAPNERVEGADKIFNGADDDASGCAAVLELAEALAYGPKPARTLLFLFATGEEAGLLGSKWFTDHPVVPLTKLACDLNLEMIGRPDELAGGAGRLWLTGFERSNLGPRMAELGLPVVADPRPSQNFFRRSDNYSLALRGVVAQTLSTYNLHRDYHNVSDEAAKLDFAHMEACVRAALLAARALADGSLDPKWNEGGQPGTEPKKQQAPKGR